jgi:hypothetical protein
MGRIVEQLRIWCRSKIASLEEEIDWLSRDGAARRVNKGDGSGWVDSTLADLFTARKQIRDLEQILDQLDRFPTTSTPRKAKAAQLRPREVDRTSTDSRTSSP